MTDADRPPPLLPAWLKVAGAVLVAVVVIGGLAALAFFVVVMIGMGSYGSNK